MLKLYDASRKKAHLSLPIDLERNPASTLKSHIPFSCGIHLPESIIVIFNNNPLTDLLTKFVSQNPMF